MESLERSERLIKQIFEEAEKRYPQESCGIVLGLRNQSGIFSKIIPCRNVQEEYDHCPMKDFSRTAQRAYLLDPFRLLAVQKEARRAFEEIRIIYHSHVEQKAVFSEEDVRFACPGGEPAYPGVDYWILSVIRGKVREMKRYHWDAKRKEFSA